MATVESNPSGEECFVTAEGLAREGLRALADPRMPLSWALVLISAATDLYAELVMAS